VAQFGLSYCGIILSEVEGISRFTGIERQPNYTYAL
jgi:hypothetical protein